MSNNGWIKLHRELKDKTIFHNEKLLKVFIWCLIKATHEKYQQLVGRHMVHLMPGQFVTGRHRAGEELRFKPSTAWDYLKVLESNGTINIKSNNKYSIISIVNWRLYQLGEVYPDSTPNSEPDNKSTTNRHKQEQKNNKKREIYTDSFEIFYRNYPNPRGKAQTFQNWNKLIEHHDPEIIIDCAIRYKNTISDETNKEFITTSYNFIGQKAVYLDYLPSVEQDSKPRPEWSKRIIHLTSEDQEKLVEKMEAERQAKIEARRARYGGQQ